MERVLFLSYSHGGALHWSIVKKEGGL